SPQASNSCHVGKSAVAVVAKQMALAECAREQILEAVIVIVANRQSEAEHRDREASSLRNICKRAVVVVVIQLERRLRAGVSRPVRAVHQNDVGPSVIVVVDECAARAHSFGQIFSSEGAVVMSEVDTGLGGDVAKGDLLGGGEASDNNQECGEKPDPSRAE